MTSLNDERERRRKRGMNIFLFMVVNDLSSAHFLINDLGRVVIGQVYIRSGS